MSIKTSKRIALGVITALVFAPFAAIAPASAAPAATNVLKASLATITNDTDAIYGRVGQQVSIPITASIAVTPTRVVADRNYVSFAAAITAQPSTTPVFLNLASAAAPAGYDQIGSGLFVDGSSATPATAAITTNAGTSSSVATITYAETTQTAATTAITAVADGTRATATFTPNAVGTYTIVVWNETQQASVNAGTATLSATFAAQASLSGSESTKTLTVVVTGAPTTVTLTRYNSTAVAADHSTSDGALIKVALTDAAGSPAVLVPGQTVSVLPTGTAKVKRVNGTGVTSANATAYLLSATDFDNATGAAYVNITSADASTTIQVSASLGTQTATVGLTFRTVAAPKAAQAPSPFATATVGYDATAGTGDAVTATGLPLGAVSTVYRMQPAAVIAVDAVAYLGMKVTDTNKKITGFSGSALKYDVVGTIAYSATAADQRASFTVASTSDTAQGMYTLESLEVAGSVLTTGINTVSSVANEAETTLATPDLIRAAPGATVNITVNLKDRFARNYANQSISVTVAGRNTATVTSKITDSAGNAVFTFTDASTSTSSLTDTITFTGPNSKVDEAIINYSTTYVPTTITLGGGNNSALGVALVQIVTKDIIAGTAGPSATTQVISATLTDATATLMAGVPVSWTVTDAGTKANILSTKATTFTNTSGVASTEVYAWANGKYTVTATAGALTASVTIDFAQETAAEARSISATASGRVVTANVKDRFGNPVPSVTVWASAPGAAFFGTGTKVASVTTDSAGNAVFVVAGADATITVTTYDPGLTATNANGAKGSGQTCAAVGKVDCAATATSFTATRVGTTALAETGVGASLAAAGVSSATAAVTGITPAVVVPAVVYDNPTLTVLRDGGRLILSGTAADGEGDIIIYTKKVGSTAWKERAKTLEVAAPGDFNGTIRAPKNNVLIRVKQEGTGQFSNQVIVLK